VDREPRARCTRVTNGDGHVIIMEFLKRD
jgi:hypothetical protein